jgi:hypothetical protein
MQRSKSRDSSKFKPDGRKSDLNEEEEKVDLDTVSQDLFLLVPENFFEIAYVNQISMKRKAMEAFNSELSKLAKKQLILDQRDSDAESVVKLKDYSQVLNVVVHILEDPNMLVFIEGIKTVEYFSILCKGSIK